MQVQDQIKSIIESLLFISDKPLKAKNFEDILSEYTPEQIKLALNDLEKEYEDQSNAGIRLARVDEAYQLRTAPQNAEWVLRFTKEKPVRLGRASLETLSIIAYRQPVTRPEVDEIRGVESGHIIRTLIERNLVKILGKREEPGNPLVYGTTPEFLHFFHLDSLSDLPSLREYTELGEESLKKLEELMPGAPELSEDVQLLPAEEAAEASPELSKAPSSDTPSEETNLEVSSSSEQTKEAEEPSVSPDNPELPAEGVPSHESETRKTDTHQ